jgi:FtsP/CotA-like multicopper oxidase with cupredoxin domain
MRTISRRRFLKILGLGAGSWGVHQLSRTRPLVSGQPLQSIPVLQSRRSSLDLVEAEIAATTLSAEIAGHVVKALGYAGGLPGSLSGVQDVSAVPKGTVPGPTLRVRESDVLRLNFINRLSASGEAGHHAGAATNLHLHGPLISPAVDDPFTVLEPGEERTIELEFPSGSAGTHWYHPHPHGQVAPQLFKGLAGGLIVEGGLDDELQDWEEHFLVIKDYELSNGEVEDHSEGIQDGKEGNLITVNAQVQPTLQANRSQLRLRLLNASTARHYRLRLEDHELHLIATDGHFLEKPVSSESLDLAPGNRVDVLISLERTEAVRLLAEDYHIPAWVPFTVTPLLTIVPPMELTKQSLPQTLGTVEKLDVAESVATRKIRFNSLDKVNDRPFDHDRVDFEARQDTLELWDIETGDHPFHLHSYPVQILGRDGVPEPYRAWRDVVAFQSDTTSVVRIAVPFRHYAGKTVFHCHISEHEDNGMMAVLNVKELS